MSLISQGSDSIGLDNCLLELVKTLHFIFNHADTSVPPFYLNDLCYFSSSSIWRLLLSTYYRDTCCIQIAPLTFIRFGIVTSTANNHACKSHIGPALSISSSMTPSSSSFAVLDRSSGCQILGHTRGSSDTAYLVRDGLSQTVPSRLLSQHSLEQTPSQDRYQIWSYS